MKQPKVETWEWTRRDGCDRLQPCCDPMTSNPNSSGPLIVKASRETAVETIGGFTVSQLWSQLWFKLVDQLQQGWTESWPTLPWNTLNCRKHKVGIKLRWFVLGVPSDADFYLFRMREKLTGEVGLKVGIKVGCKSTSGPRFASQLDEVGQTLSFQLGKSWSPSWGSSWA